MSPDEEDKPRKRVTEDEQVVHLNARAAQREAEAGAVEDPRVRARLLQTAAIYEVGAAIFGQLVKLTRATRN